MRFTDTAKKAFRKLDTETQNRIVKFLDGRINNHTESPRRYGEALSGELSELWKYRVGDYRIICEIRDAEVIVYVISIGNRREVYR